MSSTLRLVNRRVGVAIVENDALVREGMTTLLGRYDDFNIVAAVTSLDSPMIAEARPDVVLVASHLIDATNPLLAPVPSGAWRPRVIVTGVVTDQDDLLTLVRAGVLGFVVKDALFSDLLSAIRTVASGTQVVPARLYATLVRNLAREHEERTRDRNRRLGKIPPMAMPRPAYQPREQQHVRQ